MTDTMTHEEFLVTLRERFGEDPAQWAFVCPTCGDVATGQDFKDALIEHPRECRGEPINASALMGQECIGRVLGALLKSEEPYTGRGCDWAAYGLFRGPLVVQMPDGRDAYSFRIADAPSTT